MLPITRKMNLWIVALILVLFPKGLSGQEAWTLRECIDYALEKNISIKRMDLQADQSENSLKTARAARFPVFNGWATHNLSSGKTVNFEDYSYINTTYQDGNLGVQGQFDVFTGLAVTNTIKEQKWAFQAALEESERLRNSITVQVTAAFLQMIFATELQSVAETQYTVSQEQVEKTSIFVEQGTMAKANLLEMKAQMARDAYSLTQARTQVENARLDLMQLMNYEGEILEFDLNLVDNPEDGIIPRAEDVFEQAVQSLPRIKGAEYRMKSSEYALASARGLMSPSLGFSGVYYSRYSELGVNPLDPTAFYPYTEQIADNSYGRMSVNLNIPIFNQRQSRNRINQAKIQALDSRYALQEAKIMLKNEIQKAHSDAKNALSRYLSASEALESIQLSHEYIAAQYDSGLVTSLDYNLSKNQLIKTQSDLLQAKYEYLLRTKILEFYQGVPIGT